MIVIIHLKGAILEICSINFNFKNHEQIVFTYFIPSTSYCVW